MASYESLMNISLTRSPQVPGLGVVASLALLVYDYLLTLPQESACIWGQPWTPGKVLFYIVRYLGFIDVPMLIYAMFSDGSSASTHCLLPWVWYSWSSVVSYVAADAVMGFRTWAIWHRGRACGVVLATAFVCGLISTFYFKVIFAKTVVDGSQTLAFPSCRIMEPILGARSIVAVYSICAMYECLIFVATAVQGLRYYLHGKRSVLATVLYRDAFIASFCFFAWGISSAVLAADDVNEFFLVFSNMHRVFSSILPSRIILNIRQTAVDLDDWDMTMASVRAQAADKSDEPPMTMSSTPSSDWSKTYI